MSRVQVESRLLRWACERARVELAALVERFPQIPAWERGEKQPTLRQLEAFAKATHTPVGLLLLPEPPEEHLPVPDFRTIADEPIGRPSADLLDTLYLCQQRQAWYRDFAQVTGDRPLEFVGSVRLTHEVEAVAEGIRETLGFALVDDLAPLVFISGADTKAAQMFTLAHELAHLWLGESALSDSDARHVPGHEVERWCNLVAAEILAPLAVFRREHDADAELRDELDRLARRFKVSTLVVLRRIRDAGALTPEAYRAAYRSELDRIRRLPRGDDGNFYLTLGARVSKRFAHAMIANTLEGRSSFTEAFRLLGFKKMETFRKLGTSLRVIA